MKVEPIDKIEEKSEANTETVNYPKFYVNANMFTVHREYARNQFESIQYLNKKDDIRKMFVVTFDCLKKEEDLKVFLAGYKPCTEYDYESIRKKAFAWFNEYLYKYGYCLSRL